MRILTDVPSHLHYIMLELIKNSMRATVDFHGLDEMDNNPIRVVIADGEGNEVGFRLKYIKVVYLDSVVFGPKGNERRDGS